MLERPWPPDTAGGLGDVIAALQVLPPLSHSTAAWIEVIVTGPSAEARATLPLRWQQRPRATG